MATIKLSNEAVTSAANESIRYIQEQRTKYECANLEEIEGSFNEKDTLWVFDRRWVEWFKYFGPFALLGFFGYPFSVLMRLYSVYTKPDTDKPWEMMVWLNWLDEDSVAFYSAFDMENEHMHKEHTTAYRLKCMAENNEDDFMQISREEATQLGIC